MFSRFLVLDSQKKETAGSNDQSGFGLIELMVSVSIIVLVLSIVISRHDKFNTAVLLRSQAYEIALDIRDVQQGALSARGADGDFKIRYGLYFDQNDQQTYQVFRDNDPEDGAYIASEAVGGLTSVDPRFIIADVSLGGMAYNDVRVVFDRPNFDAVFYKGNDTDPVSGPLVIKLTLRDDATVVRYVEVTGTGQVTVKDTL